MRQIYMRLAYAITITKLLMFGLVLFSSALVISSIMTMISTYGPKKGFLEECAHYGSYASYVSIPLLQGTAEADFRKYTLQRPVDPIVDNTSWTRGVVIFIPGHKGSYMQGLNLGQQVMLQSRLQFFSIDFGHEASIAYAATMERQARFVVASVRTALQLVDGGNRTTTTAPSVRTVVLVGHSMGGAVVRLSLRTLLASAAGDNVRFFGVTLSSPHQYTPMFLDASLVGMYNSAYNDDVGHEGLTEYFVSFTAGTHDIIIRPRSTRHYGLAIPVTNFNVAGTPTGYSSVPSLDHDSMITCTGVAIFLGSAVIPAMIAMNGSLTTESVQKYAVAPYLRSPLSAAYVNYENNQTVRSLHCSNTTTVLRLPTMRCADLGPNIVQLTVSPSGMNVAGTTVECDPQGRGVWVFVTSSSGPFCVVAIMGSNSSRVNPSSFDDIVTAPWKNLAASLVVRRAVVVMQVITDGQGVDSSDIMLRVHCGVTGQHCPHVSTWDVQYFSLKNTTRTLRPLAASIIPYTEARGCVLLCSFLPLPPTGVLPNASFRIAVQQQGDQAASVFLTAKAGGSGQYHALNDADRFVGQLEILSHLVAAYFLDSQKLSWLLALPLAWIFFSLGQLLSAGVSQRKDRSSHVGEGNAEVTENSVSYSSSVNFWDENDTTTESKFIQTGLQRSGLHAEEQGGRVPKRVKDILRGLLFHPMTTQLDALVWRFPWILAILALCGHSDSFRDFVASADSSISGVSKSFVLNCLSTDVVVDDGAAFLMDSALVLFIWFLFVIFSFLQNLFLSAGTFIVTCLRVKKEKQLPQDLELKFQARHVCASLAVSIIVFALVVTGYLHSALALLPILLLEFVQLIMWVSVQGHTRAWDVTLLSWAWLAQVVMTACGTSALYAIENMAGGLPVDDGSVGALSVPLLLSLPVQSCLLYKGASSFLESGMAQGGPPQRWALSLAALLPSRMRPTNSCGLVALRYLSSLSFVCDVCGTFIVVWGRLTSYRVLYMCSVLMGIGGLLELFLFLQSLFLNKGLTPLTDLNDNEPRSVLFLQSNLCTELEDPTPRQSFVHNGSPPNPTPRQSFVHSGSPPRGQGA